VAGVGATFSSSSGQNHRAHHRSRASRTRASAGSGLICSRHRCRPLVGLRRGTFAEAAVELAHARERGLDLVVGGARCEDVLLAGDQLLLLLQNVLAHVLEGIGPFVSVVGDAAPLLVGTLAPPGEHGVVAKAVDPGTDKGVAAVELVIEEGERELPVESLDP
jgi:hypothetical protein